MMMMMMILAKLLIFAYSQNLVSLVIRVISDDVCTHDTYAI